MLSRKQAQGSRLPLERVLASKRPFLSLDKMLGRQFKRWFSSCSARRLTVASSRIHYSAKPVQ
jgi:hypothetical protein